MNKYILVTGGAGYVGSHACKALAAAGYTPVTLDNLIYGHAWAVKWGPLVEGDIADSDLVRKIIKQYNIDAVMHFAAYAYVGESMHEPVKYFDNNVTKTLKLLETLLDLGVGKFVFSSTCATYGMPLTTRISEEHPQYPINPYGESKLFIEKALRWYDQIHGLKFTALRYFNAAGADPEGEVGEVHEPETHLIPLVIQTAIGQREQVKIFGTNYDTADGTAIRDYIHVTDLAEAHVKAIDRLFAGGDSLLLNLGTGNGISVRQLVDAVSRISGTKVNAIESPRRAGDPPELVAAPGKAGTELGWVPRYSDLDTLVNTALAWHLKLDDETKAQAQLAV